MKHKVTIIRTEIFKNTVLVEAGSSAEAVAKVEKEWNESDCLYEQTTDQPSDAKTVFKYAGAAKKGDGKKFFDIDY